MGKERACTDGYEEHDPVVNLEFFPGTEEDASGGAEGEGISGLGEGLWKGKEDEHSGADEDETKGVESP